MKTKELDLAEDKLIERVSISSNTYFESIGKRVRFINNDTVTVTINGVEFETDLINAIGPSYLSISSIRNTYGEGMYELFKSKINKEYIDLLKEDKLRYRDKLIKEVDDMYNSLMYAYEKLGYKSDIKTLLEINELYYCEAQPLLSKIIYRVNKRNTAKSLRIYKEICDFKNTKPIECE